MNEDAPRDGNFVPAALFQIDGQARGQLMAGQIDQSTGRILMDNAGGSGTVTSFSFTDGNGFDGTVTNPTTTPALSLAITPSGVLLGSAGAITQASSSTDYAAVAFKTISVATQSDVVADSPIDTLTLAAGANITITTNAGTDTITIAASGSTGVATVTGTANRIVITGTATDPIVNISTSYVGQATITTLGTIVTGVWNGTAIANANLANSAVTIGSTSISLGASSTVLAGLTSVTSTAFVGALTGNATTATALAAGRTISITGDLAYTSPSFDGSGNVTAAGTLATVNSNVGSFTNANITVNAKGLVTAAANGTAGLTTLTIGTTTITSGTTTRVLYDNGGVLGEYVISGSGNVAMTTSPAFTTPSLGVATATSLNGNTFTTGTYTLTGTAGKTLTFTNSITLSGTDSTVMTFPGTTQTIAGLTSTQTMTNKRITRRLTTTNVPGATPTTNTDNVDIMNFTGLGTAITSMTTNLSGAPVDGDLIEFRFTDDGTARGITWGASFASTTVTMPTTTVISTMLRVLFEWNGTLWQCIATA